MKLKALAQSCAMLNCVPQKNRSQKSPITDDDLLCQLYSGRTPDERPDCMVDAFLKDWNLSKSGLLKHSGLLCELYLVLAGIMPVDEMYARDIEILGLPKENIVWKQGYPTR